MGTSRRGPWSGASVGYGLGAARRRLGWVSKFGDPPATHHKFALWEIQGMFLSLNRPPRCPRSPAGGRIKSCWPGNFMSARRVSRSSKCFEGGRHVVKCRRHKKMLLIGLLAGLLAGAESGSNLLCLHSDGGTHQESSKDRCCARSSTTGTASSSWGQSQNGSPNRCLQCKDIPVDSSPQLAGARGTHPASPDAAFAIVVTASPFAQPSHESSDLKIATPLKEPPRILPPFGLRC